MNIWYVDGNGEFQTTDNSTLIKLYDMLQRLQTFKGEQTFNVLNGVDYFSVFNRQSFLKPQIEAIEADYTQFFRDITNDYVLGNENVQVNIRVTLPSGSIQESSLVL